MSWTVNTAERFGGANRAPRINPYLPARVERIGGNTAPNKHQASSADIGKPVKLNGSTTALCGDGDVIYGFIESVEVASQDGFSIGAVLCEPGHEVLAVDEVGNLAVGDLVVAGTAVAFGTKVAAKGANVKKATTSMTVDGQAVPIVPVHKWMVMEVYGTSAAGVQVSLRKV